MSELTELLITPAPQLERVALAIVHDEYHRVNDRRLFAELDRLAEPLLRSATAASTLAERVERLRVHVYDVLGFSGADTPDDPRLSYLTDVLERRLGSVVSLALVLLLIGSRAGLRLACIGFPGHFLVRAGRPDELYLDPFDRAALLDRRGLEQLLFRLHGSRSLAPEHLAVVGAREIALALLGDLKRAHQARRDHARAMVVCDRLVDLTKAPRHFRDRGLHAFALGAYQAAVADLVRYLTDRPEADDAAKVRTLLDEALARAERPAH
ncbi:MAG: tetratricopeptide repeat protein [Deltaproteobacteria bacterium]|jgi:regulator of sirC expression with transglutaminase-like and TPR domain|nr:tetratricopeptide repeat protein [Deltaproteobacteria bacterium]MBW2530068.1 tetratricopeptide repeat protein [Deltaproteobacteria bacterium]